MKEFVLGIENLMMTLLPALIVEKIGLKREEIILRVFMALAILLLLFLVINLSVSQFTLSSGATSGIQSTLSMGAAFAPWNLVF